MNIERVKNMWDSLTRIDEIMEENGFTKERIYQNSDTFFSNDTLKIRAQLLTEDLNFYAKGYNLFNEAYAEFAGVTNGSYDRPAQSRRFIVGAEYKF